ncbi:MAG: SGNH/GDSL hydrolase family protein [Candidatus Cohnella colombiensis]|uniref:SGNH/GDSL hydrolase family protein n=1 Tax=Candidatus Cohnella colombiensis TaxID=3121368 RepID=A0AA95EX93_9BACL|nr:MAG: SGNH/GDSL hydrolase family protein [Cohnella sp.]
MIYTALGDSITFGENASSMTKGYPHLIGSALQSSSHRVRVNVLARPGWSSGDLLDAVIWNGLPVISQSGVISVWIGGVDLMNTALQSLKSKHPLNLRRTTTDYKRHLSALFTRIKRVSLARIVCCTQYNPFPNSPLAVNSIHQLNQITSEIAHRCGVVVAPTHTWFEDKQADLIYGYHKGKIEDALSGTLPIHPNDRGHHVIAKGLASYLIPPNTKA